MESVYVNEAVMVRSRFLNESLVVSSSPFLLMLRARSTSFRIRNSW